MNNYIPGYWTKKDVFPRQFPKELDELSPTDRDRVMEEVQNIRNIELAEEQQFFDRINRVFKTFSHYGFGDDVAIQLTIAFLNDPVFREKRLKRKTITEIIKQYEKVNKDK